jgi:hypothetical protein
MKIEIYRRDVTGQLPKFPAEMVTDPHGEERLTNDFYDVGPECDCRHYYVEAHVRDPFYYGPVGQAFVLLGCDCDDDNVALCEFYVRPIEGREEIESAMMAYILRFWPKVYGWSEAADALIDSHSELQS